MGQLFVQFIGVIQLSYKFDYSALEVDYQEKNVNTVMRTGEIIKRTVFDR